MYRDPLIGSLVSPDEPYLNSSIGELPPEILRDHLLRAMLAAHLAQRTILPMERLPSMRRDSSRQGAHSMKTLKDFGDWLNDIVTTDQATIGRYGALLVYAITLWRKWRQARLPCSPGFALLAPRTLYLHRDLEVTDDTQPEWRRTLRVWLAPTGCRPLRERWESAPAKAYREPITHAEVLDGLTFIVENEFPTLRWRHISPWLSLDEVRPLSARAALERRAPRVWLFPLRPTTPELTLIERDKKRPWTYGFIAHHKTDKKEELSDIVQVIKRVVGEHRDHRRDLMVFPELSLGPNDVAHLRAALKAEGLTPALLIAGSHHSDASKESTGDSNPLMRANAPVFGDGEAMWDHHKRGPFRLTKKQWKLVDPSKAEALPEDAEIWENIRPGDTFTTFDAPGGRLGVLICADLLEERFPAMRDVVRLSGVDLLIVVNYSEKTNLFMRHAEQLNRLGTCVIFLNAMTAVVNASPKHKTDIDPFTVLVALPELKPRAESISRVLVNNQANSQQSSDRFEPEQFEATWLLWSHDKNAQPKLMAKTTRGWKEIPSGNIAQKIRTFKSPTTCLIDLNVWLWGPADSFAEHAMTVSALEAALETALTDTTSPLEHRTAKLRSVEMEVLSKLRALLSTEMLGLLERIYTDAPFEPTDVTDESTLNTLFAIRLARPHRLAIPPDKGSANAGKAESHFIVSLTPLGSALVEHPLRRTTRSTRTGSS